MKSTIYYALTCLFVLFFLVTPKYLFAYDQIEYSAGIMNFDYAEYNDDGKFLDGEKGYMPGVAVNFLGHTNSGLKTKFGLDLYTGKVDYDGHLQPSIGETDPNVIKNVTGVPFQTTTVETVFGAYAQIAKSLDSFPKLSFYGNFGYKYWNRAIQGDYISKTGNIGLPIVGYVSGQTEKYQWYQFIFGASYNVVLNEQSTLDFTAGVSRTLNPTMKAGSYKFKQKERTGYELGFDWLYKLSPGRRIGLAGSLSYWEFGKSNQVDVGYGYYAIEPYSESTMTKLQFIYQRDFMKP